MKKHEKQKACFMPRIANFVGRSIPGFLVKVHAVLHPAYEKMYFRKPWKKIFEGKTYAKTFFMEIKEEMLPLLVKGKILVEPNLTLDVHFLPGSNTMEAMGHRKKSDPATIARLLKNGWEEQR